MSSRCGASHTVVLHNVDEPPNASVRLVHLVIIYVISAKTATRNFAKGRSVRYTWQMSAVLIFFPLMGLGV
jgi:hypothetical protein